MTNQPFQLNSFIRSRTGLVLIALIVIAAFYLITEHTAHVLGILPYAIFLLCPLLHLFMHGGHGGHGDEHTQHDVQHTGEHPQHTDGSSQQVEDHSHHHEEIR